jgi:hypothetical protein
MGWKRGLVSWAVCRAVGLAPRPRRPRTQVSGFEREDTRREVTGGIWCWAGGIICLRSSGCGFLLVGMEGV